jgi:hypothetical protein
MSEAGPREGGAGRPSPPGAGRARAAGRKADDAALGRVRAIAAELRDLEERAGQVGSTDIEMSLFERAAELADEAARLLEETGRAT